MRRTQQPPVGKQRSRATERTADAQNALVDVLQQKLSQVRVLHERQAARDAQVTMLPDNWVDVVRMRESRSRIAHALDSTAAQVAQRVPDIRVRSVPVARDARALTALRLCHYADLRKRDLQRIHSDTRERQISLLLGAHVLPGKQAARLARDFTDVRALLALLATERVEAVAILSLQSAENVLGYVQTLAPGKDVRETALKNTFQGEPDVHTDYAVYLNVKGMICAVVVRAGRMQFFRWWPDDTHEATIEGVLTRD